MKSWVGVHRQVFVGRTHKLVLDNTKSSDLFTSKRLQTVLIYIWGQFSKEIPQNSMISQSDIKDNKDFLLGKRKEKKKLITAFFSRIYSYYSDIYNSGLCAQIMHSFFWVIMSCYGCFHGATAIKKTHPLDKKWSPNFLSAGHGSLTMGEGGGGCLLEI